MNPMPETKRILIYLGHPAHYHNISKVAPELEKKGHKILIIARGKDVLFDLIKNLPFKKVLVPDKRKERSTLSLITSVLKREWLVLKEAWRFKANLLIGTDIVITHVGRLLNIPSLVLNEDDAAAVPLLAKMGFKFSSWTLSPVCCDISPYNHKKIEYNSYHELGYLHPNHFKPDQDIVKKYVDPGSVFFIIRFAKLTAHHDKGITGITDEKAEELVNYLKNHGKIIISSERPIKAELEPFRMAVNPLHMHHLMAYARLYVGDSQTMAAEAAVLGTPFIRFNDFVGKLGYLDELENKYNIGVGIPTNNPDLLLATVRRLVENPNSKQEAINRKEVMLNEKIDFAKFLEWFINQYPESAKIMRENPDYQERFR
jgi:uncharacterized protein